MATKPSRGYFTERLPKDEKSRRDADILNGKLTDVDRKKIAKRWNRAVTLGALGLMRIKNNRDAKREWELP